MDIIAGRAPPSHEPTYPNSIGRLRCYRGLSVVMLKNNDGLLPLTKVAEVVTSTRRSSRAWVVASTRMAVGLKGGLLLVSRTI